MDGPGATLRRAREALGLSLQDIAIRTRVAQRQLEAIERDDYEALPGIPYAIGFARAYARAVAIDEVDIAARVRRAVHASDLGANRYEMFEPVDPARVPSRMLAWTALGIALIVAIGFGVWRMQLQTPDSEAVAPDTVAQGKPSAPRPSAVPTDAAVVLTALEDVWLRIYDDAGTRMKEGLMKKGETFTLPAQARDAMILTGRPQALAVTVGGKAVPPLGPPDRTIADVPISASALLARATTPTPADADRAAPAPSPAGPAAGWASRPVGSNAPAAAAPTAPAPPTASEPAAPAEPDIAPAPAP
ncbi:RodZ domain-containing protein [Sphingobium sp. AN641]|uniref:helix-turn-helix domain-containing protein n=1 Tax=Sphingobium sp. AN641 TaxID=3133443 RepID=UPI0030BEDE0C